MKLSIRAMRVLEENGIALEKIREMTESEILALYGCGRKTFAELVDVAGGFKTGATPIPDFGPPRDYDISKLKAKWGIRRKPFRVLFNDKKFVVIEYLGGDLFKIPLEDFDVISPMIRVCTDEKPTRKYVYLRDLIPGRIFIPNEVRSLLSAPFHIVDTRSSHGQE